MVSASSMSSPKYNVATGGFKVPKWARILHFARIGMSFTALQLSFSEEHLYQGHQKDCQDYLWMVA